tara:strand:+ start:132 stop:254 length:123 start_codon:yes stop_codon:yes gene_type:complete
MIPQINEVIEAINSELKNEIQSSVSLNKVIYHEVVAAPMG